MEQTVEEIDALRQDLDEETPTLRDQAAASKFMDSVYMGIENTLLRILKFRDQDPPSGEHWHVQLFERFCASGSPSLPVFFEGRWVERTDSFRRFRHVSRHGHSLDLDWERMRMGLEEARPVFDHFREQVERFLAELKETNE